MVSTFRCPECGWDTRQPFEVVSRHLTSEGLLVWTRCACGTLRAHLAGMPGPPVTAVRPGQPQWAARTCPA